MAIKCKHVDMFLVYGGEIVKDNKGSWSENGDRLHCPDCKHTEIYTGI
jgi:hypothetical protein